MNNSQDEHGSARTPNDRALVPKARYSIEKMSIPEPVAHEFQKINSFILMAAEEGSLRNIAFTSAMENEGTTTVAVNAALALSFSQEHRVLIVDTNLRKPSLAKVFRLPGRMGLTDGLLPGVEIHSLVDELPISRLGVLTAGKHYIDPTQFFRSARFSRLISELGARYDFIVYDCASCSAYPDTLMLADKMDGVILVTKYRSTRKQVVQSGKTKLENAKANLLGVILNHRQFEIPNFIYKRL